MSENNRTTSGETGNNNYPLTPEEHAKLMDRIKNIYPKDIDLVAYAQQREYGYQVNLDSSTKQAVVLRKQDANGVTLDTIIVRKNKDTHQFYYTNPNDGKDKGPIWKFVMNRKGTTSYIAIDKLLSGYLSLDNLKAVEPQIRKVNISSSKAEDRLVSIVKHYKLMPLTDLRYLKSRGFNENVLNSYEFRGKVLNEDFKGHINTAFPMYNKSGDVVGLERKNFAYAAGGKEFGGAAEGSNKQDSVWHSTIWPDKVIKNFVLGETPIDLMSYHMLKGKGIGVGVDSNVYIASNGYWSKNQVDIVQELIQKHQPKNVILANDNDNPGRRYNINLSGLINRPISKDDMAINPLNVFEPQPLITKDNKMQVECDLVGQFVVRLRFTSVFDNQMAGLTIFKDLEDRISEIRRVSSQPVDTRIAEISDKKGVFEVSFVNATLELNKAQEIVLDVRGMTNYLKIEKSKGKDFNEDLQIEQGLKKPLELENEGKDVKINQLTPAEQSKQSSFDLSQELPNSKEVGEKRVGGLGR